MFAFNKLWKHDLATVMHFLFCLLTHFMPLVSFYTPWKYQNTWGFLTFSGGIERNCGAIKWAKNVSKKAWYCIQNTLDKIYFRCIVLSFLKNRLHIWQKMTNTMPNDFLWVSFDANEKNKAIFSSLYFFRVHKLDIMYIWEKVFKSKPSKICGRKPLKNLKGYGLLKQTISLQFF